METLPIPFISGSEINTPFSTLAPKFLSKQQHQIIFLNTPSPYCVLQFLEYADKYIVVADLPGVQRKDLQVHVDSDTLVLKISATRFAEVESFEERKKKEESELHKIVVSERQLWGPRSATRLVQLPRDTDAEQIEVEFNDAAGMSILSVIVPKVLVYM